MLDEMKVKDLLDIINLIKPKYDDNSNKKYEGYKIVRTYSAGVFAGYIDSRIGREVIMKNARRIHQWAGAASLSQLAMEGTKNPEECRFPCEVDKVELLEVIEILDCTDEARISIQGVKIWKM